MSTQILAKFNRAVIQFIDELIEQFPCEPDLVVARVMLNGQIPVKDVMDMFIKTIEPCTQNIKNRDESFFLNEFKLVGNKHGDKLIKFKKIWTSEDIDSDDKDAIWRWMDLFVLITSSYTKSLKT